MRSAMMIVEWNRTGRCSSECKTASTESQSKNEVNRGEVVGCRSTGMAHVAKDARRSAQGL